MKFGKLLLRSVALSAFPQGKWMDYKQMKKILYSAATAVAAKPRPEKPDELIAYLASVPEEAAFFAALRSELAKVALFYAELEATLVDRYNSLLASIEAFVVASLNPGQAGAAHDHRKTRSEQARQLLSSAVRFTASLIQLENYAVLNYCAFAKIMKKKEKVTGVPCKTAYMRTCVNVQEFAHYPRLLRMLSCTASLYSLLVQLSPEDAAVSVDLEDARQLADLRDVQQSSSLQRRKEMESPGAHLQDGGDDDSERAASAGSKRAHRQISGSASESEDGAAAGSQATRRRLDPAQAPAAAAADGADPTATGPPFKRTSSELDIAQLLAQSKAKT